MRTISSTAAPIIRFRLRSESAIRKAISIGGDSDTIAAIAGSIAEAYYGSIPEDIRKKGRLLLDSGLKRVLDEFEEKYCR